MATALLSIRCDMDVELMQHMGDDAAIIAAAKVSTAGALSALAFDQVAGSGLIGFLMKNRHGTPFEHNSMTFLVSAPICVFREFHRHRIGFSYNEESGRYKVLEPVFYVPDLNRPLVQQGKPGHYIFVPGTPEQLIRQVERMCRCYDVCYTAYEEALEDNIAKEVARMVLPVALYSSMYVTCNARSLMSFLSLRTKDESSMFPSYPMREIEMVAQQMEAVMAMQFPITHGAFQANGRVAP